uniref:tRNA(Ile)-lysidine synthetase n=1 Tax=viral metagenome TaxID=1070528 RepID=A0A6C0CEP7_9ZZZZ
MDIFYNDWIERKKYWFSQDDENDAYLSDNYGHLIDEYSYEIHEKPILGILIYDQLTRHYYRKEQNNHILIYFNRKAIKIADRYNNKIFIQNLNFTNWMFYMLVYRHSNIRENLLFVMNECWKIEPIPKQFIKATFNRAKFEEKLDLYDYPLDFDRSILDNNPDITISHKRHEKIGEFDNINYRTVIISLSGGVDSVVCLYNLSFIKNINIIAVHINYNNRKEVEEEVKFLSCLCVFFNVKLYVRKINEIKRRICMKNDLRDVYESYTKRVRFNSYKCAMKREEPIVILGHNKDDCLENILTNIAYNNKYENLVGFEYKSKIDDIVFIRPLIDVSKDDIYKFAKKHNLPYLKNSTPTWSQRGKIRADVVPVLEKWDKRVIEGLFNLSEVLKNHNMILNKMIEDFKIENIESIETVNLSTLYWKYGIFKTLNIHVSNKSLKSLIERLEIWKTKYDSYYINKKVVIIINKQLELLLKKKENGKFEYKLIKN